MIVNRLRAGGEPRPTVVGLLHPARRVMRPADDASGADLPAPPTWPVVRRFAISPGGECRERLAAPGLRWSVDVALGSHPSIPRPVIGRE
jgi:hypothetical protein